MRATSRVAMDASTLVDVRITYAYQNERDGLQTTSVPITAGVLVLTLDAPVDVTAGVEVAGKGIAPGTKVAASTRGAAGLPGRGQARPAEAVAWSTS